MYFGIRTVAGIQSASVEIEDAPIRFDDQWYLLMTCWTKSTSSCSPLVTEAVNTALRRAFILQGACTGLVPNQWSPGTLPATKWLCSTTGHLRVRGSTTYPDVHPRRWNRGLYANRARAQLFPPYQVGVPESTDWIEQSDRVDNLQMDHPFFKDMFAQTPERIDLPSVESIWNRGRQPGKKYWPTETGRTYFSRIPDGRGQLFT